MQRPSTRALAAPAAFVSSVLISGLLVALAACSDHAPGGAPNPPGPSPERDAAPPRSPSDAASSGGAPGAGTGGAPGAGTGGTSGGDAAVGTPETAAPPADAPAGCPPGLATPQEIAATPRANENLEQLALWLSKGKLVADQAIYDRITRDVPAIKAKVPALEKHRYNSPWHGTRMMMFVSAATLQKMRNGTFDAWVCPNRLYGALEDKFNLAGVPGGLVVLQFKGLYNEELLAAEYGRMPGVMMASPDSLSGLGPFQTICATAAGDTWHYVFVAGLGQAAYQHFTVAADGTVTEAGSWGGGQAPGRPPWVDQYANKTACYWPL